MATEERQNGDQGFRPHVIAALALALIPAFALTAIVVGTALGLLLAWNIIADQRSDPSWQNLELVVPWLNLLVIFLVVYAVALLATLAPALRASRVRPAENLLPFLYRIVRNRCYDELRRRGRFQVVSLDEDPGETGITPGALLAAGPAPDEAVHWALVMAEVRRAIDRLPELQWQALILYCEEELSYDQIAAALGTDVGTVKSRIHYARRHLRRIVGRSFEVQRIEPADPTAWDGRYARFNEVAAT